MFRVYFVYVRKGLFNVAFRFSRLPGALMVPRKILLTGLRILAVCLLFMICFGLGGVLSGLDKIGQQSVRSQQPQTVNQQLPQMPGNLLRTFLIFTLCVGSVLSYVILRPPWYGWKLFATLFAHLYPISTLVPQPNSFPFL